MRLLVVILGFCMAVLAGLPGTAAAAKQRKPFAVEIEKPIYEAPMRVVIVRNSSPLCEPNCPQWIAAEGEITKTTPALFRRVLKHMGKRKLPVVIRSPGGDISAALLIGRMLRERQMMVAVGYTVFTRCSPNAKSCKLPPENKGVYEGYVSEDRAFCNSACPMVLAGGVTRYSSSGTSIGLHEPKTVWTRERVRYRDFYKIVNGRKKLTRHQILSRKTVHDKTTYGLHKVLRQRLTAYYGEMGVDIEILNETTKAKFEDIYFLPEEQKSRLKLRTTGERASFLSNYKLCGRGATSAVCVENTLLDPAKLAIRRLQDVGVDANAPKMRFQMARHWGVTCITACPMWIAADGVIAPETPALFESFLAQQGVQKVPMVLNSPGGDAMAAIALGRLIRKAGFETAVARTEFPKQDPGLERSMPARIKVDGRCHGACVLAFAGGVLRHVSGKTRVVMQNPTLYGVNQASALSVAMNQHFLQMGVKPAMMAAAHMLRGKEQQQMNGMDMLRVSLATNQQNIADTLSVSKCLADTRAVGCRGPME